MDAARYDAWYDTPLGRDVFAEEAGLLREAIGPTDGRSVLEVGCGTGWFLRDVAPSAAKAVGVDPSPGMLAVARRRGPAARWMRADGRRLPFEAGSFDVVFENTVLCFARDPVAVIGEMVRVCRRGGVVALGELNPRSGWQIWRRIRAALAGGSLGSFRGRPADWLVRALTDAGCRARIVGRAFFSVPVGFGASRLPGRLERLARKAWPEGGAWHVVAGRRDA
jgi:ubiquinone/menaquinone biosynthesis C-methylase UbiE